MQIASDQFAPVFAEPVERNRLLALYLDLARAIDGQVERVACAIAAPLPAQPSEALVATRPSQPSLFAALVNREPLLLMRRAATREFLFRDLAEVELHKLDEKQARRAIARLSKNHWFRIRTVSGRGTTFPVHDLINVGQIPIPPMLESGSPTDYIRAEVKRGRLSFASLEIDEVSPDLWMGRPTVLNVYTRRTLPSSSRAAPLLKLAAESVVVSVVSGSYEAEDLDRLARQAYAYQAPNILLACNAEVDMQWVHALRDVVPILDPRICVPVGAIFS